ncbi:MAG: hypothetical protein KAH23_07950 [Kiritimatiellae bacterium]|nr:hypothetical protein [Kiritimatiellia bacterium]
MKLRQRFSMVMCGVLVSGFCWCTGHAEDLEPHMSLTPEEIVGVALFPDGETPVVNLPVRMWDMAAKKFVYRTRTNKHGVFNVPQLGKGLRSLFVGRVKIDLCVLKRETSGAPQHHDIVVVIPRKMIVSSHPGLLDVIIAPLLITPPDLPPVVSP